MATKRDTLARQANKHVVSKRPKKSFLPKAKAAKMLHQEIQTKNFWGEEIQTLTDQKFQNIDEAISQLVDLVIARLGGNKKATPEEREFLIDLFKADPELIIKLQEAVSLRVKS